MGAVNAIAKVRFSSVRPQRIHLVDERMICSELLCLEAGQSMEITGDTEMLYAILGKATIICDGQETLLEPNHLVSPDGNFRLRNQSEQRFVALACRRGRVAACAD